MTIQLKRIYEEAAREDGYRVLVDGLWPRGIAKRDAGIDEWHKALAPSRSLRQWFGHDRDRWDEFRQGYLAELDRADADIIEDLREIAREKGLTLLFAARDVECNNAVVLKEYLEKER